MCIIPALLCYYSHGNGRAQTTLLALRDATGSSFEFFRCSGTKAVSADARTSEVQKRRAFSSGVISDIVPESTSARNSRLKALIDTGCGSNKQKRYLMWKRMMQ
jgi:hypothetical protein